MSERWARTMLATYRLAGAAAFPLVGAYVGWRASRGKEDKARKRERYGLASRDRPAGPLIWMHAASVGETNAIVPLIRAIADYGIGIVLTTGTITSAQTAAQRLGDRVIHQYVPLDLKPAVSRFLDYWEPDLAIIAESEIWPMTILELGARRIPQVLVNGRLSDRSFKSWQKRASLARGAVRAPGACDRAVRCRRRALRGTRRAARQRIGQSEDRHESAGRRRGRPCSDARADCQPADLGGDLDARRRGDRCGRGSSGACDAPSGSAHHSRATPSAARQGSRRGPAGARAERRAALLGRAHQRRRCPAR